MPRVENVEKEEEECNIAEGLDGLAQFTVAMGVADGGEDDGDQPEVRKDEVEQEDVAVVGAQEEGHEEESDSEDGNNFEIDELVAGVESVGGRDEVRDDAHDNHGRDPDE